VHTYNTLAAAGDRTLWFPRFIMQPFGGATVRLVYYGYATQEVSVRNPYVRDREAPYYSSWAEISPLPGLRDSDTDFTFNPIIFDDYVDIDITLSFITDIGLAY